MARVSGVSAVSELNGIPEEFRTVERCLVGAPHRPEVSLSRIAPPPGLAPSAVSLAAEVGRILRRGAHATQLPGTYRSAPTTGRFVVLYDPACPEPWGGPFRVISWLRARMDPEIGHDDLVNDVSWSWLTEALAAAGARYEAEAGTASRIMEKGFGSLRDNRDSVEIEVRASWTPLTEHDPQHWAAAHVTAWCELLCTATGLPPHCEDVSYL